ncbi:MAG TPA: 5-oxoprolinase subunit PxpB [Candidatus Limnocylindrales bacterium]|nr:5-oxoprolinase subunit PxpB [Candidatus Limnocylindrales bacterium]
MWKISLAGDAALLVTLGERINERLLGEVLALDTALRDRAPRGLQPPVPAYASLLCPFDPETVGAAALEAIIREIEPAVRPHLPDGATIEVPVRYDGPDLDRVAAHSGLNRDEVIAIHAATTYRVYAIGFAPGFAYCGQLPESIATPRLPSPRAAVPSGSVGIAGRQTGIYAVESPGGWNLLGRTDLALFDPGADPPVVLRTGDRVRFVPRS